MDAQNTVGAWERMYRSHYVGHAGTAIDMVGIDVALWDIRG